MSWWLTWNDLDWPSPVLIDLVRRRADRCQASDVNCCVIFGAHFRWDFLPMWDRLHDLLRFVRDELHAREIQLFDHHSSTLVHRPRNREESLQNWRKNRHHIPFAPSLSEADQLQFRGSRLNDWRMIDVASGGPAYLTAYHAEQFCMNNRSFQDAYAAYLSKLVAQTQVDGLMSDDNIFYPAWQACRCEACLARFQSDYGRELPPTSDDSFWGNRRSEAFRDWIEMRFRSSGDFLAVVRRALPPGFPLLSCCSSSDDQRLTALGMSYQDFIRSCNTVLLEMVGSTPTVAGEWDNRVASQALHLAIADDAGAPCVGLGYGFFPETAFFLWALNKFLGSDCWFSTLKGRLGARPEELAALADDAELVEEGYRWEAARPELFRGAVVADAAIHFSRPTRDFYGQIPSDYVLDYQSACLRLMRAGVAYRVLPRVARPGEVGILVLTSCVCLAREEREALDRFIEAGGTIVATGPIGFYDQRANPISRSWLADHGIDCELSEPERPGGFPPYGRLAAASPIAECRTATSAGLADKAGWRSATVGRGTLYWRPARMSASGVAEAVVSLLGRKGEPKPVTTELPNTWRTRAYRDGDRLLVHALPSHVVTTLHPTLVNQMSGEPIVEKLSYHPLTAPIVIASTKLLRQVTLHSPDLREPRPGQQGADGRWRIDPSGVNRYFIVECCEADR